MSWLTVAVGLVTAVATAALAMFARSQIMLERGRKRDAVAAARSHLAGPAWLARRTLDSTFLSAVGEASARQWFESVGNAAHLDRLEANMLETLRLASIVGGDEAKMAADAFGHFLAFADHVNRIGTVEPTQPDAQGFDIFFTPEDRRRINGFARDALRSLRYAADTLAGVAPRRDHEHPLPPDEEVPLLSGNPDPLRLSPAEDG